MSEVPRPTYSSTGPLRRMSWRRRQSSSPQSMDMAMSSSGDHRHSRLSTTSSGSRWRPMAGYSPPGGEGINWVPISFPFLVKKTGTMLALRPAFFDMASNFTPQPIRSPAWHFGPKG